MERLGNGKAMDNYRETEAKIFRIYYNLRSPGVESKVSGVELMVPARQPSQAQPAQPLLKSRIVPG